MKNSKGALDPEMSRLLRAGKTLELNPIRTDVELLFQAHGCFTFDAVSHGAGNPQDNQHHAKMNDQTAVAALIASSERHQAANHAFTGIAAPRPQRQCG